MLIKTQFFATYTTLILSTNYVTKRQSLKLLGEILLDRANFNVMTRYIANEANLKLIMNLLRDKSRNIQFEAFHVFKVRRNMKRFCTRGLMFRIRKGLCGQSQEATADRNYPTSKQGQASYIPQGLP